jgi:hypothetical protein
MVTTCKLSPPAPITGAYSHRFGCSDLLLILVKAGPRVIPRARLHSVGGLFAVCAIGKPGGSGVKIREIWYKRKKILA